MAILIENLNFILTVDAGDRVLRDASVLVEDGRIAAIGAPADIAAQAQGRAEEVIDGRNFGMCPGFVDSHVHLSETLSRAVFPDDLDTRTWVFHWAKPFYAHVEAEDEKVGALLACAEMLRNGTTCLLDMG
ncbi:MAG: amidohydrolase, partial [Alphaproteobacteria bacterium]